MARIGFIRDKLDIKLLILYLLDRLVAPIDFSALTDLAMCDPGVDYFLFAEAINELVSSEHVKLEEERYSITDKGRRNSADCESSLSVVIRKRCDRRLAPLNAELRRSAQIHASVQEGENGAYILSLSLDDDMGNLMQLSLTSVSQAQCSQMARRFQAQPEKIYHSILSSLLALDENEMQT